MLNKKGDSKEKGKEAEIKKRKEVNRNKVKYELQLIEFTEIEKKIEEVEKEREDIGKWEGEGGEKKNRK